MKKNTTTTTTGTDKLSLTTQTLRKLTDAMSDDQLKAVVGGQKDLSRISGAC
jgi:hypothetical protein